MNTKKTLVLALVLAALAVLVVFWELPQQRDKERESLEGDKIIDIDYDAIAKIELERGESKLVFEKEAGGEDWRLKSPIDDQTERWIVQSLISAIRYAHPTRTLDKPGTEALARFGLDKPRAVLTFDAGGVVKRIRVGDKNPVGQSVYLKPEDRDVVFLVADGTIASLEKTADDFRRRELLAPIDPALKINRLVVAPAGEPPLTLVAVKSRPAAGETGAAADLPEDMTWRMDEATGPIADAEAMRALLDLVAALKATRFAGPLGEDLAAFGLDRPAMTVTSFYGEGDRERSITLKVGGAGETPAERLVTVDGRPYIFAIPDLELQGFRLNRGDLRDRRLLAGIDLAKVEAIDLQSAKVSFKISRSVTGWQFADETPADGTSVEKLLSDIAAWRATELVAGPRGVRLNKAVKGAGVTGLVLTDAEGKIIENIRLSAPLDPEKVAPVKPAKQQATPAEAAAAPTERLVALVAGGYPNTTYLVSPEVLQQLPGSIEEFKAAQENPARDAVPQDGKPADENLARPPAAPTNEALEAEPLVE